MDTVFLGLLTARYLCKWLCHSIRSLHTTEDSRTSTQSSKILLVQLCCRIIHVQLPPIVTMKFSCSTDSVGEWAAKLSYQHLVIKISTTSKKKDNQLKLSCFSSSACMLWYSWIPDVPFLLNILQKKYIYTPCVVYDHPNDYWVSSENVIELVHFGPACKVLMRYITEEQL